jgi:hypothetical protein
MLSASTRKTTLSPKAIPRSDGPDAPLTDVTAR